MRTAKLPRFNATEKEIAEIVPTLGGEERVLIYMGWTREPLDATSKTAGFWIPPFNPHIRYTQESAIKTSIWHNLNRFRRLRHAIRAARADVPGTVRQYKSRRPAGCTKKGGGNE